MSALNKYGELDDSNCPQCGNPIKPNWKACPECGNRLSGVGADSKDCPACGKSIKPGWKACPSCGHSFASRSTADKPDWNHALARRLLRQFESIANELSAMRSRYEQKGNLINDDLPDEECIKMSEQLGMDSDIERINSLVDQCEHVCSDLEAALGMSVQESKDLTKRYESLKWSGKGFQARLDYYRAKIRD